MSAGDPPIPAYGERSLGEVIPSVLASLGVGGFANPLGLEHSAGACLLVIDGLGWELLLAHADAAPFLGEAARGPGGGTLTAGFPATTAASLGSLATGVPPGEHGLVGYTVGLPGLDRAVNLLRWELYGIGPHEELRHRVVPERFQPVPTLFERARDAGRPVSVIGPRDHAGSPLSRAILRGGNYRGADTVAEVVAAARGAVEGRPGGAVYVYHPWLDTAGHVGGTASREWLEQLGKADRIAAGIAAGLPPRCPLLVTADHGMVDLAPDHMLFVEDEPALLAGVRLLGGEARARHVYARPGAARDVLAIWRDLLGERMWIASREEAIAAGWFGPRVSPFAAERIGDVVAAAHGPFGVFQRDVDPMQARFVGHHGSMTPEEQLVPMLRIG